MVLKEGPLTIRILKRIKSAVSAFQPKKSASSRQKCENHQSSGGCSAGRFWDRFGFYAVQLNVGSRHGTSGGCNWSFETALPLLPRYWACMIVEMERLMVGDWICVEV